MRLVNLPGIHQVLLTGMVAAAFLVAACAPAAPSPAATAASKPAASPAVDNVADQLRSVATNVDNAVTAVGAGDLAKARQSFEAFDQGWDKVEDDVKAKSATAYKAIEDAMDEVKANLTKADKPDVGKAREALDKLKQTIETNLPALR